MKKLLLLTLILLLIPLFHDIAGAQSQDSLYLKDGSIVKGVIVELVPEKSVRIRTADGSTSLYNLTDVEKIVMGNISRQDTTQQISPEENPATPERVFSVGLNGGLSIPVGDFASTSGAKSGAAKTGFAIGADLTYDIAPAFAWKTSFSYSRNAIDLEPTLSAFSSLTGTTLTGDAGNWMAVWGLTGIEAFGYVSPTLRVYCMAQAGVLLGSTPDITIKSTTVSATQKSASATSFAFSFGAGVRISWFYIAVRYLSGEPEYSVSATSSTGTSSSGQLKQPTAIVLITAGFAF